MKKKKGRIKNPPIDLYSNPKINLGRTKKDSIKIKRSFFVPYENKISDDTFITLSFEATAKDFFKIAKSIQSDPTEFAYSFFNKIIMPALERSIPENNIFKQTKSHFVFYLQMQSYLLNDYFKHLLKLDNIEWPKPFKSILSTYNGKQEAGPFTSFCIENIYKDDLKKLNLKPFKNFSTAYVGKGKKKYYSYKKAGIIKPILRSIKSSMEAIYEQKKGRSNNNKVILDFVWKVTKEICSGP